MSSPLGGVATSTAGLRLDAVAGRGVALGVHQGALRGAHVGGGTAVRGMSGGVVGVVRLVDHSWRVQGCGHGSNVMRMAMRRDFHIAGLRLGPSWVQTAGEAGVWCSEECGRRRRREREEGRGAAVGVRSGNAVSGPGLAGDSKAKEA